MIGDRLHRDTWWTRIGDASDRVADQRNRPAVLNEIWVGAGRPVNNATRFLILGSVHQIYILGPAQDQVGRRGRRGR